MILKVIGAMINLFYMMDIHLLIGGMRRMQLVVEFLIRKKAPYSYMNKMLT